MTKTIEIAETMNVLTVEVMNIHDFVFTINKVGFVDVDGETGNLSIGKYSSNKTKFITNIYGRDKWIDVIINYPPDVIK